MLMKLLHDVSTWAAFPLAMSCTGSDGSSTLSQGEARTGKRFTVVAEYVLRVLGLDYIADTFVGKF